MLPVRSKAKMISALCIIAGIVTILCSVTDSPGESVAVRLVGSISAEAKNGAKTKRSNKVVNKRLLLSLIFDIYFISPTPYFSLLLNGNVCPVFALRIYYFATPAAVPEIEPDVVPV
jgi:hypothetical protein